MVVAAASETGNSRRRCAGGASSVISVIRVSSTGRADAVKAVVTLSHESNPGVGPDLPDGQKQISGVATPSILNGMVQDALEDIEKRGWIMNVAANPPITEYNEDANRNEVIVPTVVRPHNHQTLASIRQIAS